MKHLTELKIQLQEALLLEVSINDLEKQWVEPGKMSPDQFDCIVKAASGKSSWVTWLGKRILEKQLTLSEEDIDKWQKVIKIFERYKSRFSTKDIFQVRTSQQIDGFVRQALDIESEMQSKDKASAAVKDEFAEFFKGIVDLDGKTFKVYVLPKGKPENYRVSRALAGNTHWCTASSNSKWFQNYIARGPLVMFFNANDSKEKYQLHAESNSFMDIHDRLVPWTSPFTRKACEWAYKNHYIPELPAKLRAVLEWEKKIPPKEGAPQLSSFNIYSSEGINIYYENNFNLEKDYWAFSKILDLHPDSVNTGLIGKEVLAVTGINHSTGTFSKRAKDATWKPYYVSWSSKVPISRAVYNAYLFLKKQFGIEIPEDLLIAFDKSLPGPSDLEVKASLGGNKSISVYEDDGSSRNIKVRKILGYPEYAAPKGCSTYVCSSSPKELGDCLESFESYITATKRKDNVWQIHAKYSTDPATQKAFFEYLKTKGLSIVSSWDFYEGAEFLSVFREALFEMYLKSSQQLPDEGSLTGVHLLQGSERIRAVVTVMAPSQYLLSSAKKALIFYIGRKKVIAADDLWYMSSGSIKSLPENVLKDIKNLLEKYKIDCKKFVEGLKRHFPNLLDTENEREKYKILEEVPAVPDLLRSLNSKLKPVDVPLYKVSRGNKIIRLKEEKAIETTWGQVKFSFAKSSPDYAKIIDKKASDSSPVYLYWCQDTWNCTVVCKDSDGTTNGIVRRRGAGEYCNWDLNQGHWSDEQKVAHQIPKNLQEDFVRMRTLAGIGNVDNCTGFSKGAFDYGRYLAEGWMHKEARSLEYDDSVYDLLEVPDSTVLQAVADFAFSEPVPVDSFESEDKKEILAFILTDLSRGRYDPEAQAVGPYLKARVGPRFK